MQQAHIVRRSDGGRNPPPAVGCGADRARCDIRLDYVTTGHRCFLALGWHPRHIAGLIRSRYERDFGWAWRWYFYDATLRADFYTRIFSGLFMTGRDDLIDFNCVSMREKGVCRDTAGACGIDDFRDSLLERRANGRLAGRPFNRLLLPAEHI